MLKNISLAHIKPFQDRAVDGNVKGDEVEGVNDKGEDVGDENVVGDVEGVGGEGKDIGDIKGVCDKGEGVCGSKVDVGSSKVAQMFDGEVEQLMKLSIRGVSLCEPFLDFHPAKLTTKDIWYIIPRREILTSQYEMLKNAVPVFKPGLLSNMVS